MQRAQFLTGGHTPGALLSVLGYGLLTREAAAISSIDTDRRLPPVPGDDEIAELARTLDGMFARLGVAFERFVRGDDARTRTAGAGLGLSIVRAAVAAHGGTVRIGNGGPLGGAVVTTRLPVG